MRVLCRFVALMIVKMCEWKIMNTEETERKKNKEKTSIWKPDIGLLNFLRDIKYTILATFQIFVVINHARRTFFKHISNFI